MRCAGSATIIGLDLEPSPCDHDAAHWARILFKRVGPARTSAVYRALSRCLHPDVGGDTDLQRELNDAYAELPAPQRRNTS